MQYTINPVEQARIADVLDRHPMHTDVAVPAYVWAVIAMNDTGAWVRWGWLLDSSYNGNGGPSWWYETRSTWAKSTPTLASQPT